MKQRLFVAAIVVAGAFIIGGYVAYRYFSQPPRSYFEFGASLVYNGQRFELSRTIACIAGSGHGGPATGRSQEAIAERLSDGSGILVMVPSLCDPEAWPLSERYVPQILWTANAEQPDVLEAYMSEELLRSANSRLTLKSVYARPSTAQKYDENPKDFTFLSKDPSGDPYREYHGPGLQYFGFIGRLVDSNQWHQVPEIAAALTKQQVPGNIPSDHYLPFNQYFPLVTNLVEILGGAPQTEKRIANKIALDDAVALRWDGQTFTPDEQRRGVVLLYRVDRVPPTNMEVSDKNSPGFTRIIMRADQQGSTSPRWPMKLGAARCDAADSIYCYEPQSGNVLELQLVTIFLVKNNVGQ